MRAKKRKFIQFVGAVACILTINAKTAKSLAIPIARSLLLRATG